MDKSLTNFELTESTMKGGSDSGSDKSEPEILSLADTESSTNNGRSDGDGDFDSNLPETVTLLQDRSTGAKVYLIGTVHFSQESKEDVVKVIRNVNPNMVVLELCTSRTNILSLDEQTVLEEAKNIDFQKVLSTIRSSGIYNGIMYILILSMSAHITKELGMAPGGEFRAAYNEVISIPNCKILLGDRPIAITLQRALAKLTWFQTFKLAFHLLTTKEAVTVEDLEKCKNRDMLEQLLAELAGEYPAFKEVFLRERDIYLTYSLQNSIQIASKQKAEGGDTAAPIVVGVVGMGHVPGITELFHEDQSPYIHDILQVTPPSLTARLVRMSLRFSLLAFGGYLLYRYVPMPRLIKENAHIFVHKLLSVRRGDFQGFKSAIL